MSVASLANRATGKAPAARPFFEALLDQPDLVWMGQNTTHLEPPPEVVEAMLQSVRRREFQLYAPPLGFSELRELIAQDIGLPDQAVMVTDGAVGGLHHICTALSAQLGALITTDPGWPWPGRFAEIEGVPVVTLPIYNAESGYKLTASQLGGAIRERSLIYLIDPLNPLGSRYEAGELEAIVALARDSGSLIVHDCTYRHFAQGHTLVASLYPEGTFTTYSFSKWLGLAGLRCGAILAQPELLSRLSAVPSNPLGANIQAQRAAIAGLKVKGPWLDRLRQTNQSNLALVKEAIETSGLGEVLVWPSHGNFLAADVTKSGWTGDALAAAFLDQGVFIRSGTYQSPAFGQRFIKVSTSVPTEWAERFAAAVAKLPEPQGAAQ